MANAPNAKLRVCASCEWIFRIEGNPVCPKCGFGHYGARYVYGDKCYAYQKSQQPWINRKLADYYDQLQKEIRDGTVGQAQKFRPGRVSG